MPDQNISSSGPREAELQGLKSAGLRSSSLSDECGEFSRLSTAFFSRRSCDVKPSLRAGGVAGVLLTKSQNHSLAKKQLLAAAAAVPATCDSATKASITSPKIASQRELPLKTVGFGSSVAASAAVVKPLETKGEARLGRKRKAQSSPSSSETTIKPENVEIGSPENPPEYRGVRVRPGVKGFLVEIRPKRWKKTIWLGTYRTSAEAARAYDAGIFYTGKSVPYNFQESEGSFRPLPKHLSLDNFDPDVMEQSKEFVKERAVEAARRRSVPRSRLPLTRNKVENETSSVGVQGCNFTSGLASENKGVKDEEYAGFDPITADPFQNLEPLPYDLPCCDKQLLGNDKDCWGRISVAVDDYMLQTAMVGDEDLDIEKQTLDPTDGVLFDPLHNEEKRLVAAETSFESIFGSESDGNMTSPSLDSWGLQSFDLGVWSVSSCAGLSLFNVEEYESCASPQVKNLSDLSFAMTHLEDPSVLCQNWEGASLMYGCIDSKYLSVEAMTMNSQFGYVGMPEVGDNMVG